MEKTAQNPTGAPRRRRRRRGSGTGASQSAPAQAAAREGGKAAQPAAKEKAPRPQPARKEGKEPAQQAQPSRGRHRGAPQAEPAAQQPAGRRGRNGGNGGQTAPAREQNHAPKPSTRAARAPRRAAEEDPGLELITRRPPKQKFANFEEYLAAHGGMTVPVQGDDPAPEAAAPQPAAAGTAE